MKDFKVGDRVRIRQWDDMKAEFGIDEYGTILCNLSFTDLMGCLCGRTATISAIYRDGEVSLAEWDDRSLVVRWNFSTDMIEPVVTPFEVTEEDFLTMINA